MNMRKTSTFGFVPWAVAASDCLGGTFAVGQETTPVAQATVDAATEPATAGPRAGRRWKMVPEIRAVEATE